MDIDQGLRLDKDGTKIALGYFEGLEDRAIMQALAPQMTLAANGQYPSYAVGAWYDDDEDTIGPHATHVPEFIPPAETWTAYVIEMHARKAIISDLQAADFGHAAGMVYSDRTVASKRLTDVLFGKYCSKVATMMAAISNHAAPGIAWDASGATPFDDIQTWRKALKDLIGIGGYTAFFNDRILTWLGAGMRAKYSHTGSMSNYEIVEKIALRDLGIRNMVISESGEYYSASASAFVSMWGNHFYIFKNAADPSGFAPTHAATLIPKGKPFLQVTAPYGREQLDLLGEYIQVRMFYLVKELDANAGYYGSDVIS